MFSDKANYYNSTYVKQFHKENGTFEDNVETEYSPESNTKSNGYLIQNETPHKHLYKIDKVIFENSRAIPNYKSKKLFDGLKINTSKSKR